MLRESGAAPALLTTRNTASLIAALLATGRIDEPTAQALTQAHSVFLAEGLACTLDRRPRRVPLTQEIEQARAAIRAAVLAQGLRFDEEEETEKGSE